MRVLITGATGFIGGTLAKELLSEGRAVQAFIRDPDSAAWLGKAGATLFKGDVTSLSSCKEAAKGADVIFHCAGVLGDWGKPDDLFWKVNYEGTRNMLEAAKKANITKFVHVSSCGIFGPMKNGEQAGDDHPHNPINIYERTKSEAEKLALSFAGEGLPLAVVRPEFVFGPGDLHLLPFFRSVKAGRFMFFGKGESTLHPTYIDDVVEALMLAADNPEACGKAFNITGERPVTVKELIRCMTGAMGTPMPNLSIPVPLAKAAGLFFDHTIGLVTKPPLSHAQVKYLSESRAFRCERARKMLGYSPQIDLEEGMRRTVAWYREKNLLK